MPPLPTLLAGRGEAEFLLLTARTHLNAGSRERIATLARHVDWPKLAGIARSHGVLPLVLRNAAGTCWKNISPEIRESMVASCRIATAHNLVLTRELLRISDLLTRSGIRFAAFKGPVLAKEAYGEIALRECGDLDLVVPAVDCEAARAALCTNGYRLREPAVPLAVARRCQYNHVLVCERGIVVELHFALAPPYLDRQVSSAIDWEHLNRVELLRKAVPVFAAEDLLLALSLHGTKHGWSRLKWVADLAESLRSQSGLQWSRFLYRARGLGCERMFLLGICLAQDLLGAEVPEEVASRAAADPKVDGLVRTVTNHLLSDDDLPPRFFDRPLYPSSVSPRAAFFHVCARERLFDKLRYVGELAALLSTPSEHDRALLPVPRFLHPLLYLVRPIRVLASRLRCQHDRHGDVT